MGAISYARLDSIADALLQPTSAQGVHARTGVFERVIDALTALITCHRDADAEILSFPPIMSRRILETSGYLNSFPHLLGCVSSLHGDEAEIRALAEGRAPGRDWVDNLKATDLVLTPAACYPLYPLVAARGPVLSRGSLFDVASYCFRREASHELGRLQAFRMREFVCIGTPQAAFDFRRLWMARAEELAEQLELPHRLAPASDPFFGRVGKLMARNQVEQSLKFELLIPINRGEQPTACMSFNYHKDHFGTTWGLRTGNRDVAHTACVAFGMDRLGLALFAAHGLDLGSWPVPVRKTLAL